jgi:hypothetical protein
VSPTVYSLISAAFLTVSNEAYSQKQTMEHMHHLHGPISFTNFASFNNHKVYSLIP